MCVRDSDGKRYKEKETETEREIEQEQKRRTCNLIVFLYNAFGLASLHCLLFGYPIERLFDYLPNELAIRFEEYLQRDDKRIFHSIFRNEH